MSIENNNIYKNEHSASKESIAEIKNKVKDISACIVIPASPFLIDERVFPSLGPIKVATELQENGNPTSVLDLSGVKNYEEITRDLTKNTRNKVFGISATTPQMPTAIKISHAIKAENPDSQVILGGPHATLVHAAFKKDNEIQQKRRGTTAFSDLRKDFDKIVSGDGEMAIFSAIDPDNKEFVIDASSRLSPFFLQRGTLDNFKPPNRELIDQKDYHYHIEDGGNIFRATSVIAQLGCPFECGFCGGRHTDSLRMTRTRNIKKVIEEIESTVKSSENWQEPVRGVMFYDDELNANPESLENLSESLVFMQKKLGVDMRFRGFVKSELFTPHQAELMYKAGFRTILTGIESGSDTILKTMNKHTSTEINTGFLNTAHNAGLRVKALMSIGHPGETENTIEESVDWVKKNLKPSWDDIDWSVITQYPGSPYYDDSIYVNSMGAWLYVEPKSGNRLWSLQMDYRKDVGAYKSIPGEYAAYVWTDTLTPGHLVRQRDYAESLTREYLRLPKLIEIPAKQFDHSMGQSLSSKILHTVNQRDII